MHIMAMLTPDFEGSDHFAQISSKLEMKKVLHLYPVLPFNGGMETVCRFIRPIRTYGN